MTSFKLSTDFLCYVYYNTISFKQFFTTLHSFTLLQNSLTHYLHL